MAGVAINTELEMLDIRHFSGRQLRPLLEHEARVWQQRLRWNYDGATELLLQYLDSRILPGFAALDRGKICGFTFCVYEGYKAVVGDAFAVDNGVMPGIETTRALLGQLLGLLRHSPDIERIESQLLLYNAEDISGPFREAGFQVHRRLFMERELKSVGGGTPEGWREAFDVQRWSPADYQAAAELIHAAYAGHIDAQINDQYRTLHGSLRFLHNIVRFPGCGVFDARSSWVLRDRYNGGLAGIVLCSRVRQDTAHITQLCVAKAYRGRRIGAHLLEHAMRELAAAGFEAVTLTVTEANARAVKLYVDSRFTVRHAFDGHVLDTSKA